MNPFAIAALASALTSPALAAAPFTENFENSSSNWFNADASAPVAWDAPGQFATTSFNFLASSADATPAFFRAQDEFNSSGNEFAGNYIAGGVTQLTYQVRHNAPAPLSFFARFSGPANFPGVAAVNFAPVLPNTWTTITVNITDPNPSFIYEGPIANFNSIFSDVGHLQIGALVPASLAMQDITVAFDLDTVSIIPAPASALALMGLGLASRRRRRIGA